MNVLAPSRIPPVADGRLEPHRRTDARPRPRRRASIRASFVLLATLAGGATSAASVAVPTIAAAQTQIQGQTQGSRQRPLRTTDLSMKGSIAYRPLVLVGALAALTLLPFVIIMVTSFVKISVVLSIVRSALGTQQIPPTQVITGLATILTVYIMTPVGLEIYRATEQTIQERRPGVSLMSAETLDLLFRAFEESRDPMKAFLARQSHIKDRAMFYALAKRLRRPEDRAGVGPEDFMVLVPSFVISELKEAFQIGFIIFVPFLIIDMVVANILMALGMQMLSPTTISLPFKLLLFVMIDGWYLITKGLITGYI